MSKTALIFGITGQDGSYLAELLLAKDYKVHGMIRRASTPNTPRIDHIFSLLNLHYGDITDFACVSDLLRTIKPDEVYNLAAQSHVRVSFDLPIYTAQADAVGAVNVLEAARQVCPEAKIYQASSSEMFGNAPAPQNEDTPMHPVSPYGIAKLYAYEMARHYRDSYKMFICNGILFNHESPRRGETFFTKKICRAISRILVGKQDKVLVGNLLAVRDWGYALEYVEAMHLMLQQDKPDDFVIATGAGYTGREFIERAFGRVGLDWEEHIKFDEKYLRPTELNALVGDAAKAKRILGWTAQTKFGPLVDLMVDAEVSRFANCDDRQAV